MHVNHGGKDLRIQPMRRAYAHEPRQLRVGNLEQTCVINRLTIRTGDRRQHTWIVATVLASAALAFTIAKFVH